MGRVFALKKADVTEALMQVENGIIPITIHDAVLIELKHKETALKLMSKVFMEQLGVVPSFRIGE